MKKTAKIMCMLSGVQILNVLFICILSLQVGTWHAFFFIILLPFIIIADVNLLQVVRKNTELSKKEWELETIREQMELESRYRESQELRSRETDITRERLISRLHQISDIINCADSCGTGSADPEAAGRLLEDIGKTMDSTREKHYCDHLLSNIILCEKERYAREKNIPIEIKASIPDDMNLPDTEWCSIWCNLLDNAIEACEKLSSDISWISVKAAVLNGYFYIKVENATAGRILQHCTDKKDRENHGFGLSILKDLAIKYEGNLVLTAGENSHSSIFTIAEKIR